MTIPIRSGPYRTYHALEPYETFVEFEGSTITIPLRARLSEGSPWVHDVVKLRAYMRLEVFPPYVNGLGTREFQFIIRDWELYGTCPLLNKLFFGDPRGRALPGGRGHACGDRLPAMLTFSVSNNYVKEGDPCDEILGPLDELELRNLTSHDLRLADGDGDGTLGYGVPGNSIYWEVAEGKGGLEVRFYKRPPGDTERYPALREEHEGDCLLARAVVDGDRGFRAAPDLAAWRSCGNVVQTAGNTVISPLLKPRTPLEVRWRLGEKPRPGRGRLRIVSPSRSLCTADQAPEPGRPADSADFPARIVYAINYRIFINRERFVEDQAGIAIAVGAEEIPPRDVTVAFDKTHVGRLLGKYLEFHEGTCTGMHTISEADFLHGANICRYWRTVPLGVSDEPPAPFDPSVQY